MFKHMFFSVCLSVTLFLVGCKCPFCNGEKEVSEQSSNVIAITSLKQFEQEISQSKTLVIVDFFATWCGPCKNFKPVFESVAKEKATEHTFITVDINVAPEVAQKYDVKGVPTVIIIKDSNVVKSQTGAMTKTAFVDFIKEASGK